MFGDATDATSRGLLALVRDVAKEFGEDVELAWIPLWSDTDKRGVAIAMALEAARVQKRFGCGSGTDGSVRWFMAEAR